MRKLTPKDLETNELMRGAAQLMAEGGVAGVARFIEATRLLSFSSEDDHRLADTAEVLYRAALIEYYEAAAERSAFVSGRERHAETATRLRAGGHGCPKYNH